MSEKAEDNEHPIDDESQIPKKKERSKSLETLAIQIQVDESPHSSYSTIPEIYSLESLDSVYLCPVSDLPSFLNLKAYRKYEILDYDGNRIFYAAESSLNSLSRFFLSESRPFQTDVYNLKGRSVLKIRRGLSCSLCICGTDCFCSCCNETSAFDGQINFGKVKTISRWTRPSFVVEGQNGSKLFTIYGPKCSYFLTCKLCNIAEFPICIFNSEISVGKIRRGYDGLNETNVPNPNTVAVIFPPNCTYETKTLLVAAAFMLDVVYFHRGGRTFSRFIRRILTSLSILILLGSLVYILFLRRK